MASTLPGVEEDGFPLGAVYAVLVVLGAVLGVWGAFLVPLRLHGGIEGLADVIAFVGNLGVGLAAAWGARSVVAAGMPGIGWLVAVLLCGSLAFPGDEVIIPGQLQTDPGIAVVGTLFLLSGAVGAIAAVLLANRKRAVWQGPRTEATPGAPRTH